MDEGKPPACRTAISTSGNVKRLDSQKIQSSIQIPNLIESPDEVLSALPANGICCQASARTAAFNRCSPAWFPIRDFREMISARIRGLFHRQLGVKSSNLKGLHHLRCDLSPIAARRRHQSLPDWRRHLTTSAARFNKNTSDLCNNCGDRSPCKLKYDVNECQERHDLSAPLKVTISSHHLRQGSGLRRETIRDIKEQEFSTAISADDRDGTFIINGTEPSSSASCTVRRRFLRVRQQSRS